MATKEAVAQLALLPERVAIVETKVHQIEEKIDELRANVKEMHDCLDNTRDLLASQLKIMSESSSKQHDEIYDKIGNLEKFKNKWTMYMMALLAFGAGTGWIHAANLPEILKFLGL
jgi:tetrahydromethanopterin S-methyltransferase subunit B